MRLGVLLSDAVLMVQTQGEMKRTPVGRWHEVQAERRRALQFMTAHVYIGQVVLLSIRCLQSLHTRLSLLSMDASVESWINWFTLALTMKKAG